jgi:hypothetical protein
MLDDVRRNYYTSVHHSQMLVQAMELSGAKHLYVAADQPFSQLGMVSRQGPHVHMSTRVAVKLRCALCTSVCSV